MTIIVIDDTAKEVYSSTDKYREMLMTLLQHEKDKGVDTKTYAIITENTIAMRKDTPKTIYTLN